MVTIEVSEEMIRQKVDTFWSLIERLGGEEKELEIHNAWLQLLAIKKLVAEARPRGENGRQNAADEYNTVVRLLDRALERLESLSDGLGRDAQAGR